MLGNTLDQNHREKLMIAKQDVLDKAHVLEKEYGLSKRETEVVAELITGVTNKEIANTLFVTEKTVKFHLTNIYKKLGTRRRLELAVKLDELLASKLPKPQQDQPEQCHSILKTF
jgi:DNA-binding CsgD family transcriptional regulator